MAKDGFYWTDELTEKVIQKCMLSKDESDILKTRVRGYTVKQQALAFDMSESTVARIIAEMKKKYDAIQKQYPDEFPLRKSSKNEEWMDKN